MHPAKVNKLILYASLCGGKESILPNPQVLKALAVSQAPFFTQEWIRTHPNYLASIPQSKEIDPLSNVMRQHGAVSKWGGTCNQLPKISNPTLVITGTGDLIVPPANYLVIAGKIPGAWLVQIKGGGHGVMFQYPESS